MDLETGIKHILDGDAIILMGAGASYGAENALGKLPSGAELAKDLYQLCGISPDDESDLQDAAQLYEEKFSSVDLIRELLQRLICIKYLPYHVTIYSQPWLRYYTTNYDDVAFMAAKERNVHITPVTLSSDFKKYHRYEHLCIHINGYINQLTEDTLHDEFKLTTISYLSGEYIRNSPWGELLSDDIEAAKCIVVVGMSLKNDLDLGRILFGEESREKTLIIDRIDLSENSKSRLQRFGEVYQIGIAGFAKKIEEVSALYKTRDKNPIDIAYTCFNYLFNGKGVFEKPNPSDIFNLFFAGKYSRNLFHRTDNLYDGIVERVVFEKVHKAILEKKKYIFIHSDMGNGKTACVLELKNWLSRNGFHVFSLFETYITNLSKEVLSICSIDAPCIVIVENYTNYMEVLQLFSHRNIDNIQFVLTARSALNFSKMPDVFSLFSIAENESAEISLNKLTHEDIEKCAKLFDRYGLWGKNSGLTKKEKMKLLKSRKSGNSQFQSILIDIMQSEEMTKRVRTLVDTIQNESTKYHNVVVLILIVQIMNLRFSARDIEKLTGQSITIDARFRTNPAVRELLDFNDGKTSFSIKSPVTANLILQEIAKPEMVIDVLQDLAIYAIKFHDLPKYSNLLINIISFSHISSFLKKYDNFLPLLTKYYDKLSEIEYYRNSNFFWLQYAISCIETKDFERAQKYLENAYGLVPEKFVPFQINNQQARLYLELIVSGKTKKVLEHYKKAHNLLLLPVVSKKDNEINVVRLFGYYTRKNFQIQLTTDNLRQFHREACKEAFNRLNAFLKWHPEYSRELKDLSDKLMQSAFAG